MAEDINSALDTIRAMLDSPDAGEKIGAMLGALTGGAETEQDSGKDDNAAPFDSGDIPIESIIKIAGAYKSISKKDDPRVNLLRAIKPYVRESRGESVDTAIKLLSVMKLAPLLGDLKDIL